MHSIKNASASIGSKNNIAKASKAAIIPIVSFGFSIIVCALSGNPAPKILCVRAVCVVVC